jgi:hypothetical protein
MNIQPFESASGSALSNIYPSTHYDYNFYIAKTFEANQAGKKPRGHARNYGYVLIGDLLVPLSFVETIKEAIRGFLFQNDSVLCARDMFETNFLCALDANERKVLMSVVLILIEQGNIDVDMCPADEEEQT